MEIVPYESCEHCDGEGYFKGFQEFNFVEVNVPCSQCCGLGWNTKEVDTEEDQVA
jgi:DnaJ-class molecular chaperone